MSKVQKNKQVIIKGPLPGEAVDRYLKKHGHLPNSKLDKSTEKRFDEVLRKKDVTLVGPKGYMYISFAYAEQFLANELAIKEKEIVERVEKLRRKRYTEDEIDDIVARNYNNVTVGEVEDQNAREVGWQNEMLDQAIKIINDQKGKKA